MKHSLVQVTGFDHVAPFALRIRFSDQTIQVIDFEPILAGQLYGPLRDPALFRRVKLDREVHTLVWPNGADFDPATLHAWPRHLAGLKALASRWAQAELEDEWLAVQQAQAALERCGPFHSLSQAAQAEGLPLSTLAQAAREGRLPALAVPGGWLVRPSAIRQRLGLQGRRGRPRVNGKPAKAAQPRPKAAAARRR